jgi:hypothetical protein
MTRTDKHPGSRLDLLLGGGLFAGYLGVLLATTGALGYARDEGFYYQASSVYEKWFELLWHAPSQALKPSVVDQYWSINHEHPAFIKSLFALSHHFLYLRWHWLSEPGTACRLPGMVFGALAVSIVFFWGRRTVGRIPGLVGALLFGLMPRVFYHSHLDCFDIPVATMWLVTTYAYWRSLTARGLGWPIATGLLYGLLLDTKHNSWLLPGALVLHLLATRGALLWREVRRGRVAIPAALVAMATVGPMVFYLGWPWIWHDTGQRLGDYVAFHAGHEYYNMEFLGWTYWKPPMPRLYAWVMTLGTVPAITLGLSAVGLVVAFRHGLRHRGGDAIARDTRFLWLVCWLVSYAPWWSTKTPIFGGTKHWLTAYPYLCLFAALGFARARERILALWPVRSVLGGRMVAVGLAVSVLLGPAMMTADSHPWGLSAYTPLVGGAPGAASLGLNRTFWGYTTGALVDFLNQHVPRGGAVYLHDTAAASFALLKEDGRLRSDISGTLDIHASEYALYHHEPHMSRVEHQIWVDYGTTAPAEIGTLAGVPVAWVYARPRPPAH